MLDICSPSQPVFLSELGSLLASLLPSDSPSAPPRLPVNATVALTDLRTTILVCTQCLVPRWSAADLIHNEYLALPARPPPRQHIHPPVPHRTAHQQLDQVFHARTRWIATELGAGRHIPHKVLSRVLANRRIPAETLAIWVDVLARHDVYYALERLGLLESAGEGRERVECPEWLFLSIPGMLKSAAQAAYLASMLGSSRYRSMDNEKQGLFSARCIQHFLAVGHYVAVRETVEWVCRGADRLDNPRTFARCLEALASHRSRASMLSAPPSELLHPLADMLRATMVKRGIKPTLDTFLPLFSPTVIPQRPSDAARLLLEMVKAGFPPKASVLHRVMRVYAKAGDIAGAELFYSQLVGEHAVDGGAEGEGEGSEWEGEGEVDEERPHPSAIYATTRLNAIQADHQKAIDFFDELLKNTGRDARQAVALPPLVDGVTWSSLFRIIAHTDTISSQDMLAVFRKLQVASSRDNSRSTYKPPPPSIKLYHTVMHGLLRRDEPRLVFPLWNSLLAQGLQPDAHLVDILARAYFALDQTDAAIRHLKFYAYRPSVDPPPAPRSHRRRRRRHRSDLLLPLAPLPHSVLLDAVPINNLLNHHNRKGSTLNVYRLFTSMKDTYGVDPDAASLTILLDAARYASAAAGRGYGPGIEEIDFSDVRDSSAKGFSKDTWGERPAWKVAEGICWQVLEENWPDAGAKLRNPMDGDAATGVLGWLTGRRQRGRDDGMEGDIYRPFSATLAIADPPRYPHLYPTQRVFRSLIQLIGYHSSPRSIPLVLAWMRHIGIEPSRHTLGLAMMYVGELGLDEVRMARWREWLEAWLGVEKVPVEAEIAWMRRGGGKSGVPKRR